jgi:hypothetical protein
MRIIKWVGFRLLVNLSLKILGRKPKSLRAEVEWKALPYDFRTDYLTEDRSDPVRRTGTRVKPRSSQ